VALFVLLWPERTRGRAGVDNVTSSGAEVSMGFFGLAFEIEEKNSFCLPRVFDAIATGASRRRLYFAWYYSMMRLIDPQHAYDRYILVRRLVSYLSSPTMAGRSV
jgi:hypothetical protein